MPRPYEYSPARRYAMQIAMWLVLAATLGLAHVVASHRARAERVELDEPINLGDVRVRLPRDWEVSEESEDSVVAEDAAHHRKILLAEVSLPEGQTVERALAKNTRVPLRGTEVLEFPGLGRTGVLARGHEPVIFPGGRAELQVVEAGVKLPPNRVLVLQIEQLGPHPDKSNEDLLKRIVGTITPNPGPSLRSPEQQRP